MDKTINITDVDRLIVGVREWAFQTVLSDPYCGQKWEEDRVPRQDKSTNWKVQYPTDRTTDDLIKVAQKLEKYVLGGIIN